MERKRVNSSKIRSIGYDEKSEVLEVEMSNGQVFQYSKVYPEVHRRFMAAPNPTAFQRLQTAGQRLLVSEYGTTHLICRVFFPGMPHRHIMRELELLSKEVLPAFA